MKIPTNVKRFTIVDKHHKEVLGYAIVVIQVPSQNKCRIGVEHPISGLLRIDTIPEADVPARVQSIAREWIGGYATEWANQPFIAPVIQQGTVRQTRVQKPLPEKKFTTYNLAKALEYLKDLSNPANSDAYFALPLSVRSRAKEIHRQNNPTQ